jgi:hypothetical protein
MRPIDPVVAVVILVLGLALVFVGRRLFWLFVGAVGFVAGVHFAPLVAPGQPAWGPLLIAAGLGIVGAVLAVLLQRFAVALAGWFAGGLLASRLALELGWSSQTGAAIAFVVGAIVVAIAFSLLFDWALIGITTVIGALMICDTIALSPAVKWIIAAVLVVVGFMVQARALASPPEQPAAEPRG